MTNKTPPQWRSVVSDSVIYDSLTGTYRYTHEAEPVEYDQFWTPMGQPRRLHSTIDETLGIEIDIPEHWTVPIKRSRKEPLTKEEIDWRHKQAKDKSPRKEKKKPKKKTKI